MCVCGTDAERKNVHYMRYLKLLKIYDFSLWSVEWAEIDILAIFFCHNRFRFKKSRSLFKKEVFYGYYVIVFLSDFYDFLWWGFYCWWEIARMTGVFPLFRRFVIILMRFWRIKVVTMSCARKSLKKGFLLLIKFLKIQYKNFWWNETTFPLHPA